MNSQLAFSKVLEDFLNLLLDEGGMDTVAPEVRSQMHADLQKRLNERFFATMISVLPEAKVTELRELSATDTTGEAMEKFIQENIPQAQEIFSEAMITFRKDYLGLT